MQVLVFLLKNIPTVITLNLLLIAVFSVLSYDFKLICHLALVTCDWPLWTDILFMVFHVFKCALLITAFDFIFARNSSVIACFLMSFLVLFYDELFLYFVFRAFNPYARHFLIVAVLLVSFPILL